MYDFFQLFAKLKMFHFPHKEIVLILNKYLIIEDFRYWHKMKFTYMNIQSIFILQKINKK